MCSSCDSTRDAAVSIFDNLSRQCSDPDVCVTMCQYLIEILLGKGVYTILYLYLSIYLSIYQSDLGVSGKVSVVEHRMSVLNGAHIFIKILFNDDITNDIVHYCTSY